MKTLHYWLIRFCLWQMRLERDIGTGVGMNPTYLAHLGEAITDMEGDLHRLEVNHA